MEEKKLLKEFQFAVILFCFSYLTLIGLLYHDDLQIPFSTPTTLPVLGVFILFLTLRFSNLTLSRIIPGLSANQQQQENNDASHSRFSEFSLQLLAFFGSIIGVWLIEYSLAFRDARLAFGQLLAVMALALFSKRIVDKHQVKTSGKIIAVKGVLNLFGIASFTILAFLALELGTRVLIGVKALPKLPTMAELFEERPRPLPEEANYRMQLESNLFPNSGYTNDDSLTLWLPADFDGEYYSTRNNIRTTSDQPNTYDHSIYVFGGSTIFSLDAPDYLTIPSYLQRMVNEHADTSYRVVNLGVIGFHTVHQYTRLLNLDLQPGDIVIFYDGENDTIRYTSFGNYQHNPTPAAVQVIIEGKTIRNPRLSKLIFRCLEKIYQFLEEISNYSRFVQYMRSFNWDLLNTPVNDPTWTEKLVDHSVSMYHKNIQWSHAAATEQGAAFIHFIQPTLFAQTEFTQHEQKLINSFGTDYSYRFIQEEMIARNHLLTDQGIHSVDLTSILAIENRPGGADIYYDHCHVNYIGNRIVAEAIFEELQPYLK
jgi:hypothetical protein